MLGGSSTGIRKLTLSRITVGGKDRPPSPGGHSAIFGRAATRRIGGYDFVVLVSFQMLPEQPVSELLDSIQIADELGYYACYSADEIYHKDAWLLLAAAARTTRSVRLGPCLSPILMRDPTYVAQLAATLDELSDGRSEIVFGIGNIAMLEQYGVEWRGDRPIARLREAHHIMRTILDEGSIDFDGDFYVHGRQHDGPTCARAPAAEDRRYGRTEVDGAGRGDRRRPPDGVRVLREALAYVVDCFSAGARRADRTTVGLDLGDSLLGAIAADRDVREAGGRILAAFYIPSMPPALLERHGITSGEVAAGEQRLRHWRREASADGHP